MRVEASPPANTAGARTTRDEKHVRAALAYNRTQAQAKKPGRWMLVLVNGALTWVVATFYPLRRFAEEGGMMEGGKERRWRKGEEEDRGHLAWLLIIIMPLQLFEPVGGWYQQSPDRRLCHHR